MKMWMQFNVMAQDISSMTLVINVNIIVWKRRTSECCTIYTIYLHTSNKYIYIYGSSFPHTNINIYNEGHTTAAINVYI